MTSTPDVGRRPGPTHDDNRSTGGRPDPLHVDERRWQPAAEMAVLGALMMAGPSDSSQRDVEKILRLIAPYGPAAFYRPIHQTIFRTILDLRGQGRPHGALEVAYALGPQELQRIGGANYLHSLISSVPTVANGPVHAMAMVDEHQLRTVHETAIRSAQLSRSVPTNEAGATLATIKQMWSDLVEPGTTETLKRWGHVAGDVYDLTARLAAGEGVSDDAPIPTGVPDLDKLLNGGWRAGQLIVLAGRPGIGKTVVGGQFAAEIGLNQKRPFPWFSREMSALEMGQRLLSAHARVLFERLRTGTLDEEDWTYIVRSLQETEGAGLAIDDSPTITMPHIDSALAGYAAQVGQLGGFGIDYAQIIDQTPETMRLPREQQVSRISATVKLLTRKYRCPGFLLAQLNREVDKRADKTPQLSDLRESGSLEQDADIVILLNRPDAYDPESERAGEMDLIVAKNRGGRTDTITVAAQLHLQRIAPI